MEAVAAPTRVSRSGDEVVAAAGCGSTNFVAATGSAVFAPDEGVAALRSEKRVSAVAAFAAAFAAAAFGGVGGALFFDAAAILAALGEGVAAASAFSLSTLTNSPYFIYTIISPIDLQKGRMKQMDTKLPH